MFFPVLFKLDFILFSQKVNSAFTHTQSRIHNWCCTIRSNKDISKRSLLFHELKQRYEAGGKKQKSVCIAYGRILWTVKEYLRLNIIRSSYSLCCYCSLCKFCLSVLFQRSFSFMPGISFAFKLFCMLFFFLMFTFFVVAAFAIAFLSIGSSLLHFFLLIDIHG